MWQNFKQSGKKTLFAKKKKTIRLYLTQHHWMHYHNYPLPLYIPIHIHMYVHVPVMCWNQSSIRSLHSHCQEALYHQFYWVRNSEQSLFHQTQHVAFHLVRYWKHHLEEYSILMAPKLLTKYKAFMKCTISQWITVHVHILWKNSQPDVYI